MGFIYEELNNGRTYLLFNVIDDFGLPPKQWLSLPSARIIRALEEMECGASHRCDNEPKYINGRLSNWTKQRDIRPEYI